MTRCTIAVTTTQPPIDWLRVAAQVVDLTASIALVAMAALLLGCVIAGRRRPD